MPAGSKTDSPLAKAKPISVSVITYLRREKKKPSSSFCSQREEREDVRNNFADTKEDLVNSPGKWTTADEGIQYLRELAVLEVIYSDLDDEEVSKDPGDVLCMRAMWRKASTLAVRGTPRNQSSPAPVRGKGSPRHMPCGALWFFLRDQGEDMRKWDGEPTFKLEARVRELRGKTAVKKGTPKKAVSQEEERDDRVYWTVWIRWPGTSDPQKYKALVDTGAQCTLLPSGYRGTEPIRISGVTGGCQELSVLEAEVSFTGDKWEKHPIVTGPEAPCILGIDYLRRGYFKDPKGYRWAFGVATVNAEKIKQLSTLPGLSEDPFVVGLLQVEEQQVPIATRTVHRRQYRTNRDSLAPIHELIHQVETQGVISKTHSPFNSPIWPVQKSDGGWRLTVDYRGLNKVTPPLSAAVPDLLELQYELESKAAKWYATIDIANVFFSIPLAAECRPQFAFTWRGVQYTWNRLPQGWKHSSYYLSWTNPNCTGKG
ncbi:hypothetical protein GRJ2_002795600 [Grus japonensis]|uniref:ribonuclease H n=1 Tax=Grus japonensis TaxID=30415 RepID=A0ABC9XZV5_GRUJA